LGRQEQGILLPSAMKKIVCSNVTVDVDMA